MKICNHSGCQNFVFSHSFCKQHQYDRVDDKYRRSIENRVNHNSTIQNTEYNSTGESELFDEIWITSNKRSFVSGDYLTPYAGKVVNGEFVKSRMFHWLFHHVLKKELYKRFILYKKNIILLSPQEHTDIHSLDKEKLLTMNPRWKLVFDLHEELIQEYKQTKK